MPEALHSEQAAFQLSLPCFDGPVGELTELIDRGVLSLSEVSLSDVTRQFAVHVRETEAVDLQITGEFMRVTARLLLKKSESLLPRPEVEEWDEDERPVRSIRATSLEVRDAALRLAEREGRESFPAVPRARSIERLVEPRSSAILLQAWAQLCRRQIDERARVAPPAFVRLEAALSNLIRRIRSAPRVSLLAVLRGARRQDAVIHFLALLELVRRRDVTAVQSGLFSDISMERSETSVHDASRAG